MAWIPMMFGGLLNVFNYYGITGYGNYSFTYTLPNTHIYYLDYDNGNDSTGDGTTGSPWKTLTKAQSVMVSGDTIYLRTGNYGVFSESSATGRTNWITFKADTGHTPVFTAISLSYSSLTTSYLRFDGIEVSTLVGNTYAGINPVNARLVEIRNCKIHYTGNKYNLETGIYCNTCSNILVYHNEIYYSQRGVLIGWTENMTVAHNYIHTLGGGTGVYYGNAAAATNLIVEYNYIADSKYNSGDPGAPAEAIHGSGISLQSDHVIIRGNILRRCGSTAPIRSYPDVPGMNIYSQVVIENNLVYDSINGSNGCLCITLAGEDIMIRNNILANHIRTDTDENVYKLYNALNIQSLADGYDGSGIHIYNNICIGASSLVATSDIKNNIFWSVNMGGWQSSLADNNIVVSSGTDFSTKILYFTDGFFNGIDGESDFDAEHNLIKDFTLTSDSPAINYGNATYQSDKSLGILDFNGFILDNGKTRTSSYHCAGSYELRTQIIADHTIVADYSKIPQAYIDIIKTMFLNIPGESHGRGYMYALDEMETLDSKFISSITWTGAPAGSTSNNLRGIRTWRSGASWADTTGEEHFYTNSTARTAMKNHLTYMRTTSLNPVTVFMFGWCWDMTWHNGPGGTIDPVYNVHWAGASVDGPEGDLRWGLDSGDQALTGNSVCMDTYLNAVEEYNEHDPLTNTVFTTGPVDSYTEESGYQRYLKHKHIRDFVQANSSRILFDYADILAYNNAGIQNTETWDGHTFQFIHSDNLAEYDGGQGSCHVSQAGCLRLGKALWWMLARIAGWDGN